MVDAIWPRVRVLNRQMYIDLVRAYLRDYGTQNELARSLNLTEAYVSFILEPFRLSGQRRRDAYWGDSSESPMHEVAEALKYLKAPSVYVATQIAERLCSDMERREALLHHVHLAIRRRPPPHQAPTPFCRDEVVEILRRIGDLHAVALRGSDPQLTRLAYAQVWASARYAINRIDPEWYPIDYCQTLMFLHDAASVLDRQDLALGYARRARLVLTEDAVYRAPDDHVTRLRINAAFAEVVSLNNLGLKSDAMNVALKARKMMGYAVEPAYWMRSFFEQQLSSTAALPRLSIYSAEKLADQACELVPADTALHAGIRGKLAEVYLAQGSLRSIRKARQTIECLALVAGTSNTAISPLRRVILLRTLMRIFHAVGDLASTDYWASEARTVAIAAGLKHQQAKLLLRKP